MIYQEDKGVEHCANYTMSLRKVLKCLLVDVGYLKSKGFIDIECGKGYAIKLAGRAGFRISGGIEYNR